MFGKRGCTEGLGLGTLSHRNFLTFNHDPYWLFCLPYDFALRVEIGECDTMSIVPSKTFIPLSLIFRVQRRIFKISNSTSEKCSKIYIFTFAKINM